ncbi:MAG: tRNA (N(6)-L-threonylcarbamoyladenosine(37)-C(2))-methylthiotransferase MtaB [Spirochaetales bacterium]|nr:tRNA (N(6)-L-threonylcarbamoyladenosine(37)-C(2))-methylthiotransferase MtaB [Spirochaetales bacterium]
MSSKTDVSAKTAMNSKTAVNRKKTIAFKTLGCRLNQYEIDALATEFAAAGYRVVGPETEADAYVINTCTVTNQSDVKSRNALNRILRHHPEAVCVVTGCFAEHHLKELKEEGAVTFVVPNEQKRHIFTLLDSHFSGEIPSVRELEKDLFGYGSDTGGFHTRSMVKIQDGCDNFCTYCIIPFVRGRAVSRPFPDVLGNVHKVLADGAREIVLTGVNISRYQDGSNTFTDLIEGILAVPGDFRLRITSMEPDNVNDSFLDLFSHPKMCPHLHLCLQSGSDRILSEMMRSYTMDEFAAIADGLRSRNSKFNLTTDIMTGFPGETEEDHRKTLDAIERFGFGHIHTFKYSVRSGTAAEKMGGQVAEKVKTSRSADIRGRARVKTLAYRKNWIGGEQTLLIERLHDGHYWGYGEYYTPIKIPASSFEAGNMKNRFVQVRITGIDESDDAVLTGTPFAYYKKNAADTP